MTHEYEIEKGALEKAGAHGRKLAEGFTKILKEQSIPAVVQGPDTMPGIVFTCAAHTDEDADFTLGVFEEAVKEVNSKR